MKRKATPTPQPQTRDCPTCAQKGINSFCSHCNGHGWQARRIAGTLTYYVAPGH